MTWWPRIAYKGACDCIRDMREGLNSCTDTNKVLTVYMHIVTWVFASKLLLL